MLKNKFMILAILPFMLSACGGGGASDSNSANNNQSSTSQDTIADGTRYYFMDYNPDQIDELDEKIDELNIAYFEIFNKKSTDSSSNQVLGEYLLTEKKLYSPTDKAINVMNFNSLTDWRLDLIGDVKEDWKFQRVDLSNKNMFDTVLPGYRAVGFPVVDKSTAKGRLFLNIYGQNKFPEGSSCYRLISKKSNQETFVFNVDQNHEINQSFEDFDAENGPYLNYLNQTNPFGFTYKAVKGTWQNIPWTTIYDTSLGFAENDGVAVQYQDKTYAADYTSNIGWTAEQEIKHWEIYLKNIDNPERMRVAQLRIAQLKSGCYSYNETAANALAALSALDWKPY
ncbi:hypothetical protein [Acinetobacter baumannii]|uniref:hypothetical protein n=1 Tax=Acinetobacter baumannii TaxID=470 RepID=UPI0002BAA15E|nr:hypothetical protein [Acinetobacter baumannii]